MDAIDDKHRAINPEAKALNRGKLGSAPPVKAADDKEEVPERYSEFGKIPVLKESKKKNSIALDQRNLSIGRARYEGATHLSKNVAILPHYGGNGADLINHTNVEIHLYDDKTGKEVPMTDRYFRDWAYYPTDPKKTIATLKKGDDMTLVPGGIDHFIWESPSVTDAPGQQNITQDKRTYMYIQEFITGSPRSGGFYYQVYSLLDPDGTSRNAVKNKVNLTPDDFKTLQGIIAAPNFSTEYKDRFVISNLPNTVDSDSGIDRSVPNAVAKKKALQKK